MHRTVTEAALAAKRAEVVEAMMERDVYHFIQQKKFEISAWKPMFMSKHLGAVLPTIQCGQLLRISNSIEKNYVNNGSVSTIKKSPSCRSRTHLTEIRIQRPRMNKRN